MLKNMLFMTLIGLFISACGQDQFPGQRISPAESAAILKDRLDLTDEQKAEVEKILEESQSKMQEFRKSFSGDRREMRDQIREMQDIRDDRIKELLDDVQKLRYEEYRDEQRQNRRGRFRENRDDRD